MSLVSLFSFLNHGSGNDEPIIDVVLLNANGAVYWNGEKIEQFTEEHIEYTFSVEIAQRLHQKFRSDGNGDLIHLKVDGQSLVGWNNRLVDVIYGLVEYKLTGWNDFVYQVDDGPAMLVEVGLHRNATQIELELIDNKKAVIDTGLRRQSDKGFYLVVLGGDEWELISARDRARSMFGNQLEIGFEQRLQVASPLDCEGLSKADSEQFTVLELEADGRVRLNGESLGSFNAETSGVDNPANPLVPYWEGGWDYFVDDLLLRVDGSADILAYWELMDARRIRPGASMVLIPTAFFEIDDDQILPMNNIVIRPTKLKIEFTQGQDVKLAMSRVKFTWHTNPRYPPRLVCSSNGPATGTVHQVREQIRQELGPNAEIGVEQDFMVVAENYIVQ